MLRVADLEVHYLEAGDPGGTPAIFVHGNWATASWWEPLLVRLPAGYRGLAYDVRGRGSTMGADNSYAIGALVADLLAFATAAGVDRFHLVGHSLGGAIAMQAALDAPDRVRSLAAIAPAWVDGAPAAYNLPDRQIALKNDAAFFAAALKPLAPSAPDDDFWKRLVREGHEQGIEATLRNLDALEAWRPGDQLATITAPTLVIAGTLDPLTGGATAERAAAALGTRLVTLDGVGHSPNIEAPDRVAALLAELWRSAPA
jgi:pimeloyl-ACP methyl ester carboxylesterase